MDLKGIFLYLAISFLLVFVLGFVLVLEGALAFQSPNIFQYLGQLVLMGIPAVAALVAGSLSPKGIPHVRCWPIARREAMGVVLLPMLFFGIAYAIAWSLGLTYPQWNLAGLVKAVEDQSGSPLAPNVKAVAPWVLYVVVPVASVLLGATVFTLVALVNEYGWRAFLLPRLLPLGRPVAYGIVGVCWGLWFFPLIYGWHREVGDYNGLADVQLRFVGLGVALSVYLGELQRRGGHLGITALALGSLAGQATGIWEYLFQQSAPPWTGPLGWIAIAVLAAGALAARLLVRLERDVDSSAQKL